MPSRRFRDAKPSEALAQRLSAVARAASIADEEERARVETSLRERLCSVAEPLFPRERCEAELDEDVLGDRR